MTSDNPTPRASVVPFPFLPWIVAAVFLVLYLVTLNPWISSESISTIAKVTGWDWTPMLQNPLYFLATLPMRVLPVGIVPVVMNIFSAVCAALTMALLARSIQILPHDRSREQRERERSDHAILSMRSGWIAVVAGVAVAGLHFQYWKQATIASSETLDLLLLAYVIRCLLEFRLSRKHSWLIKLALVYGLGVTGNWAMIGAFPFFVAALIWIMGLEFFRFEVLAKMLIAGFLGLLLYLLLPAVAMASGKLDITFWQAMKSNMVQQKNLLQHGFSNRFWLMLLGLTSLAPMLFIGIRWPSSFGDISAAGSMLTRLMIRLLNVLFLLGAAVMALEVAHVDKAMDQTGLRFYTLFYLAGLAAGYCTGFIILVFGKQPGKKWKRSGSTMQLVNQGVHGLTCAFALVVAGYLIWVNWPQIHAHNRNGDLRHYAETLAKDVPAGTPSVLLSDDGIRQFALNAVLDESKREQPATLLNSRWLESPDYHRHLRSELGDFWPELPEDMVRNNSVDNGYLSQLVRDLSRSNHIYYLHDSFGYYFEWVYPRYEGQLLRLHPFTNNAVNPPPHAPATMESQASHWTGLWQDRLENLAGRARGVDLPPDTQITATYWSRSLNQWAVALQRAGQFDQAAPYFDRAFQLNSNNVVALINREFNEHYRAGLSEPFQASERAVTLANKYRRIDTMLNLNGEFDEPANCIAMGQLYASTRLVRQAAQQFTRALTLAPENQAARTRLAQTFLNGMAPDMALQVLEEIRGQTLGQSLGINLQVEMVALESTAYMMKGDFGKALEVFEDARTRLNNHPQLLGVMSQLFLNASRNSSLVKLKTEELIDLQLEQSPTNVFALNLKGQMAMMDQDYALAAQSFERVAELDPGNKAAQLNRAIARLQAGRLDMALEDYETLLEDYPEDWRVLYGLGTIAEQQDRTQDAAKWFQQYLEFAPKKTSEYTNILQRLDQLDN